MADGRRGRKKPWASDPPYRQQHTAMFPVRAEAAAPVAAKVAGGTQAGGGSVAAGPLGAAVLAGATRAAAGSRS